MSFSLSPNTQAILLLTAPLIAGRATASADLLSPGEYKRLARQLRECKREPADLLANDRVELFEAIRHVVEIERLSRLLERGFLLSQAVERWQTRAIWVMSRADNDYPKRLKSRLKQDAPPILYGCGEPRILGTGGLAVVGSRNVDDELIAYTEEVGRLAAAAQRTLVSGGARGIDQAAMRGALDAGGRVIGVLADSLERAAMNRGNRDALMNGQLVLISPYDPGAGFNVGHAMQRNKLIYSLADAALVVNSDFEKGGTWNGAVEQLDMPATMPVYVRSIGKTSKGLEALRRRGALHWPNPSCESELLEIFSGKVEYTERGGVQSELSFAHEPASNYETASPGAPHSPPPAQVTPAEALFAKVRELLAEMGAEKTDVEVAVLLDISKVQAKEWLERLVVEGVMKKSGKPAHYTFVSQQRL